METVQHQSGAKNVLSKLQSILLFAGLPDAQIEQISRMMFVRKVPHHKVIVHAGETTGSLFVIAKGRAKVLNRDIEGNKVILTLLGTGGCFGEMGLMDGSPRSADVVANEECELLEISKLDFKKALVDNVDLGLNIMKSLVLRLREANRKIESLALMDVYGHVTKLLLDLSEKENDLRVTRRKVTKQDMAKMVGASREMVSRVMKDLEPRHYIRIEAGRIVINED